MLVTITLIVAIVIGIAGIENFTARWDIYTVRFKVSDDIGGLAEGDEVRLGGYKVGTIRDIDVTELEAIERGEEPAILVEFTMPDRYVVRENAQIAIQETVTGTAWLNISNLGTGQRLEDGASLAGGPSTTTRLLRQLNAIAPEVSGALVDLRTQTFPRVNATLDKFGQTADTATQTVAKVRDRIDPAMEKYASVTDRAAEAMGHMRDILGDTKEDIRGTMSNLNVATGSVREKLPGILEKLDASLASARTAMEKSLGVLEELGPTMTNARHISDSARSIIAGNRGKIEDMITSLKTAGENLKHATAEIRRSPWRLLYKPRPNEMANLNLYDAAREFADGANDLNDAATSLRDALQTHDLTDEELQKLLTQLNGSFANFTQFEQALWDKVKE